MFKEVVLLPFDEISSHGSMKDIMALTAVERETLEGALAGTHGTVQVWIHAPFMGKARSYPPANNYMTDFDQLVRGSLDKIPVIAFIGSSLAHDPEHTRLTKDIQYYTGMKTRPLSYYLRTYENDPTPCLNEEPWRVRNEDNWDTFVRHIKEIGVRQAIVSGKFFLGEGADYYYRGCVGYAVGSFEKRGVKCFQSRVTFPDIKGRKGYVRARINELGRF